MKAFLKFLALSLFFPSLTFAFVDMRNANFTDVWTDIKVPGTGYDLKVVRSYNSRSIFNGMFGFGWCSNFETKLEILAEGSLKVTECGAGMEMDYYPKNFNSKSLDQSVEAILAEVKKRNQGLKEEYYNQLKVDLKDDDFLRREFYKNLNMKGQVKEGTVYMADGRSTETIVLKEKNFVRTLPDGTQQRFNGAGQITHYYDKNGNYILISYNAGLVSTVTDNKGRKLSLTYDPKSKKVIKIVGPSGLVSNYTYSGEDLRTASDSKKETYQYDTDDLHNLTKIVFPDKTTKTLTYNKDKDWVTSFKDPKGCVESYSYEDDKEAPLDHYWSKVVKKCDKRITNNSTFEFWHRLRGNGKGRYLFRSRSEINGDVTDIIFHELSGKPVSIIKNLAKTTFEYYPGGQLKKKNENNRDSLYTYENKCQKVAAVEANYYVDDSASRDKASTQPKIKKLTKTIKTSFRYDGKCNLELARNSQGQVAQITYDPKGRITKIVDQSKKVVEINYDERFGKPSSVSRPGLGTMNISYKTDGEIDAVRSKDGPYVAIQVAGVFNNLLELISPATDEATL